MKELFKKTAIGLSLTAVMMSVALPAMAGDGFTYDTRFERNCQMKPTEFCQKGAQVLSERPKWLPIVAHGGNEKLFNTVKKVVRRLNDVGVRAYLVHAPDRDNWLGSMHVDYYANGGTKYYVSTFDNAKNDDFEREEALFSQALKAYESEYGQVASTASTAGNTVAAVDTSTAKKSDANLALR